jgi:hypothetical protein
MEDFVAPWRGLPARDCERFALVWESAILQEVNVALTSFITQQAVQQVTTKTLQTFFYTGLVSRARSGAEGEAWATVAVTWWMDAVVTDRQQLLHHMR